MALDLIYEHRKLSCLLAKANYISGNFFFIRCLACVLYMLCHDVKKQTQIPTCEVLKLGARKYMKDPGHGASEAVISLFMWLAKVRTAEEYLTRGKKNPNDTNLQYVTQLLFIKESEQDMFTVSVEQEIIAEGNL